LSDKKQDALQREVLPIPSNADAGPILGEVSPVHVSRRTFVRAGALTLGAVSGISRMTPAVVAQSATPAATPEAGAAALIPEEAQAIARDAFIYGFPIVENYKTIYAYAIDEGGPNYKAPFNEITNLARVFTPADTTVISPNSDTPYSFVMLDLRAEPVVLTVDPIREDRYFSWQNIDLYTYLAPYIGSRTTGNGGGRFLFAGPSWSGETPGGSPWCCGCRPNWGSASAARSSSGRTISTT
jgi:hypothetical protein